MATTRRATTGPLIRKLSWCGVGVCALVAVGCVEIPARRPAPPARELSSEETILLEHAEQLLVGRCMRAHGLTYIVGPPPAAPRHSQRVFPYGIDDVSWARVHGFGGIGTQDAAQSQHANPNSRYVAGLPEQQQDAYLATLQGTPGHDLSVTLPTGHTVLTSTRGCMASARHRLYGDFPRWFRASTVVNHLDVEIQRRVLGHPRYQRGLAAWSQCMRGNGHPAANPQQLRAQLIERSGQASAHRARGLERTISSAAAAAAVAGVLALAGSLAIPGTAEAGDGACDRGNFCAWQHTNYDGHRESWSGDDRYWGNNDNINDQDSSWRNAGISGPGVRDHVQVYDGYQLGGAKTICLRPGERVAGNGNANDRGSSHTWTFGC